MSSYRFPELAPTAPAPARTVYVVASGDLRPSANVKCWPAQQQLEADVTRAVESFGWTVVRGHAYDERDRSRLHRQPAQGTRRVPRIPPDAPLLVVEAVWQYSHHVLAGLRTHRGPDPGRRQLERHVPRPRGPAQPHRQPDQGRRRLLLAVERGLHRRWASAGLRTWLDTGRLTTRSTTCTRSRRSTATRPRSPSAGPSPTSSAARRRSSACSTRGAWGCTTRSSTTSC